MVEDVIKDAMEDKLPAPEEMPEFTVPTKEQCVKAYSEQAQVFMHQLETCSKRQLVRILQALVVDGYNSKEFQFSYTHEKELFQLGANVFNAKAFILHHGCLEHEKKQSLTQENNNGTKE